MEGVSRGPRPGATAGCAESAIKEARRAQTSSWHFVTLESAKQFLVTCASGLAHDLYTVSVEESQRMAIFGIGAQYSGKFNMSEQFFEKSCACVGWPEAEAPPAHEILRHVRTGDIVFIKSFTPQRGLTIKGVGIVTEGNVKNFSRLGMGVSVKWLWKGQEKVGLLKDHWPVRTVTIYEEFNPTVQKRVLNLLMGTIAPVSAQED